MENDEEYSPNAELHLSPCSLQLVAANTLSPFSPNKFQNELNQIDAAHRQNDGPAEKVAANEKPIEERKKQCRVCKEVGAKLGLHYGAEDICANCDDFFRNHTKRLSKSKASKKHFCSERYNGCIRAGMKPERVGIGKRTNKKIHQAASAMRMNEGNGPNAVGIGIVVEHQIVEGEVELLEEQEPPRLSPQLQHLSSTSSNEQPQQQPNLATISNSNKDELTMPITMRDAKRFAKCDHNNVRMIFVADFASDLWTLVRSQLNLSEEYLQMFLHFQFQCMTGLCNRVMLRLEYRRDCVCGQAAFGIGGNADNVANAAWDSTATAGGEHDEVSKEEMTIVHAVSNVFAKLGFLDRQKNNNNNYKKAGCGNTAADGDSSEHKHFCKAGRPKTLDAFRQWAFDRGIINPNKNVRIDWPSIGLPIGPCACPCQKTYPLMEGPHRISNLLMMNGLMSSDFMRTQMEMRNYGVDTLLSDKFCVQGRPLRAKILLSFMLNSRTDTGDLQFVEILDPLDDEHAEWQQVYFIYAIRDSGTEASQAADDLRVCCIGTKLRVLFGYRSFVGLQRRFFVLRQWYEEEENAQIYDGPSTSSACSSSGSRPYKLIGGKIPRDVFI